MEPIKKAPWFKNGLKFKCTGCGKCCHGSDGYVFLSKYDINQLANHLQISVHEFIERYARIIDGQIALLDAPETDYCIFLRGKQCSVYAARPIQCQTFPWWLHHLKSPQSWEAARTNCEGIEHPDAPVVPGPKIAAECMRSINNLVEQNSVFD